jgi:hypothetical protein
MPALFIVGNTNQYTFANAITAAHLRERDKGRPGLTDIFVWHSPESEKFLAQHDEWKHALQSFGIDPSILAPFTVDLTRGDSALRSVTKHIERALSSIDRREDIYVDLTNGKSLYKNVLSNIAFVLGVRRQFILDNLLPGGTPRFFTEQEMRSAYVELPDPSLLDSIAPHWLTEVRRFNIAARKAAEALQTMGDPRLVASGTFEADINQAVNSWFEGEKRSNAAALGGAVRSVGRAFEDLIRGIHGILFQGTTSTTKTMEVMLRELSAHLSKVAGEYEPQLLQEIADLLRRLRNASTHEPTSPDFGRIRARISTELLLATVEYFKTLNAKGLLSSRMIMAEPTGQKYSLQARPGEIYFFGLDGDDTGRELERLFQIEDQPEAITKFSKAVDSAIKAVAKSIAEEPIKGSLVFSSGDDILFKGIYVPDAIEDLRALYKQKTKGFTCSVGFGSTLKEAYVALKMAKASPGKDCVVGVELVGPRTP